MRLIGLIWPGLQELRTLRHVLTPIATPLSSPSCRTGMMFLNFICFELVATAVTSAIVWPSKPTDWHCPWLLSNRDMAGLVHLSSQHGELECPSSDMGIAEKHTPSTPATRLGKYASAGSPQLSSTTSNVSQTTSNVSQPLNSAQ